MSCKNKSIAQLRDEYAAAPDAARLPALVVAAGLNLSPLTIERWRSVGKGPSFVRIGRRVSYRKGDVEAWLDASGDPVPEGKPAPKRAGKGGAR